MILAVRTTTNSPGFARMHCWYWCVSLLCYTYKPFSWIALSVKKPHQNPLGRFKDLSIHRDRQREVTLFYTMYDTGNKVCQPHLIPSYTHSHVCLFVVYTLARTMTSPQSGTHAYSHKDKICMFDTSYLPFKNMQTRLLFE
jgi:hypothetical protein